MRRLTLTGIWLYAAAVACFVVAFLERHISSSNFSWGGFGIEGAYFNRSVGSPASAGIFSYSGNWFDPFKPLNPYLWLGVGIGLAVAASVVVLIARRAPAQM